MTIYDKVKELADRESVSIAALEVKAGIANGTISGWKNGKPYAETLKKVADTLDVSMDEIMEGTG